MTKQKIVLVAAARPNFMKIAPIYRAFSQYPDRFDCVIVHTGQHYDANMSDTFFTQLAIPKPDVSLGVGSGSHARQTAEVMVAFEQYLLEKGADWVIVVGDVNSTIACALAAKKLHVRVAHVEAGLRSFDRSMPEEINRLATDAICDVLFTPSPDADVQLLKEGQPRDKIVNVGNVMIDTLVAQRQAAEATGYYRRLGMGDQSYIVLTLHRPATVDTQSVLTLLLRAIATLSGRYRVICPMHPRTKKMVDQFGLTDCFDWTLYGDFSDGVSGNSGVDSSDGKIMALMPLGYNEMLNLVMHSRLVMTDSGGLQEETAFLKIPCITLRNTTERPVTVDYAVNKVVGTDPVQVLVAVDEVLASDGDVFRDIPNWDGGAAQRIIDYFL